MQKRNFILLVIVLVVVMLLVLGFLYSRRGIVPEEGGNVGTNFIARYNPFASKPANNPTPTPPTSEETPPNIENPETPEIKKLIKVSGMPVAGFGVYKKERLINVVAPLPSETIVPAPKNAKPVPPLTEFVTALRYVARKDGNIYQTFADKIEERKFSATVIPKIYEASFGNQALAVIMRYLKPDGQNIETFLGTLPSELIGGDTSENNEVVGSFLPSNVTDVSISPDAKKVFYLFNIGESAIGTTLNLTDNKKVQVLDTPFTEWLSQWPKSSLVTLTTKPSASVLGYLYFLDLDRKTLTKTLGGISGLTTLTSPDGKLILYAGRDLTAYVYHTDTRDSSPVGIRTMPEKCVWGSLSDSIYCAVPKSVPAGNYPDSWYKGQVSFADQIWKIDLNTGNTSIVSDLFASTLEEIDGTKLALDESSEFLFFMNKKDSYLWELSLK